MPVREPSYDNIARVIGQMRADDREFITPETVAQFAGCTEGEAAVAIEAERLVGQREVTSSGRVLSDVDFELLADAEQIAHHRDTIEHLQRQVDRLLRLGAMALERTQVDDPGEATMLLEQVVTLSGEYVPPNAS